MTLIKAQFDYIKRIFTNCTMTFRINTNETIEIKPVIIDGERYLTMAYKGFEFKGLFILFNDCVNIAGSKWRLLSKFEKATFKTQEGNTVITFPSVNMILQGNLLQGDFEFTVPGDLLSIIYDASNFDCKGYNAFMKDFLGKSLEHFRVIDSDEFIGWDSKMLDDKQTLSITVRLECGKGWDGHHMHTADYDFHWQNGPYRCNRPLYDKDHEAQIVRKFIEGVNQFDCKPMPQYIKVHIIQEFD